MGLQSTFKKAGRSILKAFGDVPVIVTYTVHGDSIYNELTDVTTVPSTSYPNIKMFLSAFTSRESQKGGNEDEVLPNDIKGTVSSLDLGFKPAMNHTLQITSSPSVTIRSGDVYSVKSFVADSAEAMFTMHLRTK